MTITSGTDSTTEELLTLGDAAAALGYSYRHVRRLVASGALAGANLRQTNRGGTWRVEIEELERFADERGKTLAWPRRIR